MKVREHLSICYKEVTDILIDIMTNDGVDDGDREQSPAVGDVVLTGSNPIIILYQFAKRLQFLPFSHAAISLGPRLYVDAMPNQGLGVRKWKDLKQNSRFRVLRLINDPCSNPDRIARIIELYGRPYSVLGRYKSHPIVLNRASLDIKFGRSIYCSEFIGEVYSRKELGITDKHISILPSDLKNIMKMAQWKDVTAIYENYTEDEIEKVLQDARELVLSTALEVMNPINAFKDGMGKIDTHLQRLRAETEFLNGR